MIVDETKGIPQSILHQLELLNARQDRTETRLDSMESRQERMETTINAIHDQSIGQNKRISDHNHRIADIEQELRIGQ